MKKALCWLFVFFAILPFSRDSFATTYPQKNFDHDRFLGEVLFGRNEYNSKKDDPRYRTKIEMLQKASYLSIDQFTNNDTEKEKRDQKELNYLRRHFVQGLPWTIAEINPSENDKYNSLYPKIHREFTHRGWRFPYALPEYGGDIAKSEKRNAILYNTVAKVFSLRIKPQNPFGKFIGETMKIQYEDDKCDAICRLIYYVHVLGDCYEDDNFNKANGDSNGKKIPLGRKNPRETKEYDKRIQDTDIIGELFYLMPDLFSNQTHDSKYKELIDRLNERKAEIRALYGSTGGITAERYQEYHKQTDLLMDVLLEYIPELLQREPFFNKVFPAN